MTFVPYKADIDERKGDVIGSVFAWYEDNYSKGLIGKNIIPCLNGAKVDGFEFVTRLREESSIKEPRFIVVKNCDYVVTPLSVEGVHVIDILRKYGNNGVDYWFEIQGDKQNKRVIKETMKENCFVVKGYALVDLDCGDEVKHTELPDEVVVDDNNVKVVVDKKGKAHNYVSMLLTLLIPYKGGDANKMKEKLMDAEQIVISGMEIDASLPGNPMKQKFVVVTDWSVKTLDLNLANLAIANIESWKQLAPLTDEKGVSLFSDSINATILANAFFSKKSVPAFNLLAIGPKRNQKTAALSFLTRYMMGGSIVSGSGSTGKGWLVSHKEGVSPSLMFSEKSALMIDEALKFKSGEDQTIAVRLKNHFVSHMELIERKEVKVSSGNGTISGRMKCSLVCVDNPDLSVMRALGIAYKMQDASFRRWSFIWMDRKPDVKLNYMTTEQAHDQMVERMKDFGGIDAVRALMHVSRKKCEREDKNADEAWVDEVISRISGELDQPELFSDYKVYFQDVTDPDIRKVVIDEAKEHLENDLIDAMQAAWVSAAVMRGWEACKSIDTFVPVYDEKQRDLAEMIIREIFKGRLKILFPGIIEWLTEHFGVKRTSLYESGGQGHSYRRRY